MPVACPLKVGAPLGLDTAVETEEPVPCTDSVLCTLDVGLTEELAKCAEGLEDAHEVEPMDGDSAGEAVASKGEAVTEAVKEEHRVALEVREGGRDALLTGLPEKTGLVVEDTVDVTDKAAVAVGSAVKEGRGLAVK